MTNSREVDRHDVEGALVLQGWERRTRLLRTARTHPSSLLHWIACIAAVILCLFLIGSHNVASATLVSLVFCIGLIESHSRTINGRIDAIMTLLRDEGLTDPGKRVPPQ